MKIVSLRIFVALVGLGVLWVIVPDARSDDAADSPGKDSPVRCAISGGRLESRDGPD